MSDRARPFDLLLHLLNREEAALLALVQLAAAEQAALVSSDYLAVEVTANEMQDSAERLEVLEREREMLMESMGFATQSLAQVAREALRTGRPELEASRQRLLSAAEALREVQEHNASLILSAAKLRERWFSLLAGLGSSTYGPAGRQEITQGRRVVSKSA